MIEKMIIQVKQYLPLKISEVQWDGTVFQIYGDGWNFTTLSSWRILNKNKMILGCFDDNSEESISCLKNIEIVDISFQSDLLKIDPKFILSNGQSLEIFSTDTYEPWIFFLNELGAYIPTQSEPDAFNPDRCD